MLRLDYTLSFSDNKLSINLESFGHGYLSNSFIKLDMDDSISSFTSLAIGENFEFVKWHHRLIRIRNESKNRLAKEAFLG